MGRQGRPARPGRWSFRPRSWRDDCQAILGIPSASSSADLPAVRPLGRNRLLSLFATSSEHALQPYMEYLTWRYTSDYLF